MDDVVWGRRAREMLAIMEPAPGDGTRRTLWGIVSRVDRDFPRSATADERMVSLREGFKDLRSEENRCDVRGLQWDATPAERRAGEASWFCPETVDLIWETKEGVSLCLYGHLPQV